MPSNTIPIFPLTPVIGAVSSIANSTARTDVAGTGTNTAVTPTSTNGKRIDSIVVQLQVTSAAAIVLLFIYDGTTQRLFDEIPIPAITVSNTVAGARIEKFYNNLVLPASYRIFACTTINQATNVFALGGDY